MPARGCVYVYMCHSLQVFPVVGGLDVGDLSHNYTCVHVLHCFYTASSHPFLHKIPLFSVIVV